VVEGVFQTNFSFLHILKIKRSFNKARTNIIGSNGVFLLIVKKRTRKTEDSVLGRTKNRGRTLREKST
jgi:hypothetical protein